MMQCSTLLSPSFHSLWVCSEPPVDIGCKATNGTNSGRRQKWSLQDKFDLVKGPHKKSPQDPQQRPNRQDLHNCMLNHCAGLKTNGTIATTKVSRASKNSSLVPSDASLNHEGLSSIFRRLNIRIQTLNPQTAPKLRRCLPEPTLIHLTAKAGKLLENSYKMETLEMNNSTLTPKKTGI